MADKARTVLIGSSLDEGSEDLLRTGVAWARATGAKVHVAHAFSPPLGYANELGPFPQADAFLVEEENRLRDALAEQAERAGVAPDELSGVTLQRGAPHRVLCGLAEELDADLLLISATVGGRLHRMLGSTADRIIRRASCPVLVLRGELPVPPRRVLAPVDVSSLSGDAFRIGLERLRELRGGEATEIEALFVLSVIQRQVAPQFTPEQVDRFAAEELERFVERHAGGAAPRVQRKVRTGNTREQILEEIGEARPDLVLVGTHGLGGFDRVVIGSVAADVIRESPCSVLVMPAAAMQDQS
ncbi:MAG TPA: universal stress protein [Thermoanaerobaculia bacterium]